MDQYKTEKEFFHSKFYGLIVKAQIHELFNEQFTKGIMGNLADMEANLKNPYKAQKLAHINQMQKEMKELLKNRISSPSSFESLIFSDGTIMKFAGDNLDKILADDPVKMKELTNKLIMKAFQESGEHSFADRFAQIQIEGQVGIEGIEDAVAQANEEGTWMKIGSWRFGPNNYAMGSAKEFFGSTAKVKSVVNWKNLPIEERKIMSTSIMYDAVLESQNERAYPADTGLKVMQAISGGSSSYDTYVIGGIKLKGIISKATDNATNGYVNYNQTVEKQAKSYAVTWYKKYPKLKSSMTKAQLENYLVTKIKEEHMNRNVTDRLLSLKDKNGKTIEDRIATKIKKRTTNKVWGNTPEQKARVQKRRMQEATNPWPIGPKY